MRMNKLGYRECTERITDLFSRKMFNEDDPDGNLFVNLMGAIFSNKDKSERVDAYTRALLKVVPYELAFCRGTLHLFNGVFYQPISDDNLRYGIEEFLFQHKVRATDRSEQSLYSYVKRVKDKVKEHVIKPRMGLMCFTNCVVDFNAIVKSGKYKVYEFGATHDVIKQYPFKFDRRQLPTCVTWNSFLGETRFRNDVRGVVGVLPEHDKRRALQMFLGACLVDRKNISFEYFMIMQGVGANGKSVINKVLGMMFGEEEMLNIKMSQFSRNGDEGLRAIAAMEGKRLLHSTESSKRDFKDTSVLKALSSGEAMAGRALGQNISQLTSPPLLIANSNYRWKKDDFAVPDDMRDISVQRRAIIVNFDRTIPADQRDTMLAEKLRAELSGIFAWIVKGLCDLASNGWRMPEIMDGRLENHIKYLEGDVKIGDGDVSVSASLHEWLRLMTCFPSDAAGRTTIYRSASDIHSVYDQWCAKMGIQGISVQKIGRDLGSLGYPKSKRASMVYTLYIQDRAIANHFNEHEAKSGWSDKAFIGEEITFDDFFEGEYED